MWGIYDLNGDFWNSYRGWVELRGKHFKNNKVSSPGVSNTVNSSSGVLRRDNCTNSESGFPPKTSNIPEVVVRRERTNHSNWNINTVDPPICNVIMVNNSTGGGGSILNVPYWQ